MPPHVLLTYADLREKKGIPFSRVHLWRMIRDGDFPAPIELSPARKAWVEEEIDEWIDRKMSARR